MSLREELLSKMTDEELVSTINSIKLMENANDKETRLSIELLIREVAKRKETTNNELLELQDYIVNSFLKSIENK